jgi:high-affinity nickel-transport protein
VVIGLANLVVLVRIIRDLRRMRRGEHDAAGLETQLGVRGPMRRPVARVTRMITRPRQLYPLGLLFGLGFDTATEIALLGSAGSAASGGASLCAVLSLPVLFTAWMTLLDTIDGMFMNMAYGWALSKPARKVAYNVAVTALSVAVALLIGTIELLRVSLGWPLGLGLDDFGYVVVGLLAGTWAVAVVVWRAGGTGRRWPGQA